MQGWGSITNNPSEIVGKRLDGAVLDLRKDDGEMSTDAAAGNATLTGDSR